MHLQRRHNWQRTKLSFGRGIGMLLLALVSMAVVTAVLALMAKRAGDDIERQNAINAELAMLNGVMIALLDVQTGQRGYLLSGRIDHLAPYQRALGNLHDELQALEQSAQRQHTPQTPSRTRLNALLRLQIDELAEAVRLRQAGEGAAARRLALDEGAQLQMNELRQALSETIAGLRIERAALSAGLARDASQTRLLLLIGVSMLALFAGLALWELLHSSRQLRAAERQVRGIADNVPALITQFDSERRLIFVNAHAGRVYGLDHRSLLGKTVADVRGDEAGARLQPYIDRVMRGERVEFESHSTIAGRIHHFQQNYVPDIDKRGRVRGFYSVSVDVSEVKASEQRLRAITDNLPVLITYIDEQLRLQSANATFKEWLGIDPAEMLGRPLAEVIGAGPYAQREPQLLRALAGERVQFELSAQIGGATRHLHNTYIPDVQADGRVAGIYTLSTDISAMKQAEQRLAELARNDALTGLPNRRQLDERLVLALARSRREGTLLALLFLDIDHFKAINDSHGHAAGDAVLKEFSQRLQACVRATDMVGRLAGDEFVIILEGLAEAAAARVVAQKIVQAMELPMLVADVSLQVGASIGVALHSLGADGSPQQLMALADQALYRAKREGRNRYAMVGE